MKSGSTKVTRGVFPKFLEKAANGRDELERPRCGEDEIIARIGGEVLRRPIIIKRHIPFDDHFSVMRDSAWVLRA